MASFSQWKDIEAIARAVESARPRLIHIVREIWRHERSADRKLCPCKCGSRKAIRVEVRPHLQVLIDRVTGERRVRREHNAAAFDRLAARADRIEMPFRCYQEQIAAVLDRKHKVIGLFGGNRSGKSEAAVHFLVDRWLEKGGKGAEFWWVSPKREQTTIGVGKLIKGERTDRFSRGAFHPSLVRSCPKSELSKPQHAVLVDGSKIAFKFAGKGGGNLKGRSAVAIVLDEGAEIQHEVNFTILVNRLMDSGGQIIVPTTPVAGHWLKRLNDEGVPYHALTPELEESGKIQRVTQTLSCLINAWTTDKDVQETIDSLGGPDDPRVKREVFGLWVASGNRMWRHWEPKRHMIEGLGRDPSDFGYINVTSIATRHFLPSGARCDVIAGWDCNDYPQSLVLAWVVVKPGQEQGDPANWILFVHAEIVKHATIVQWADYLSRKAYKDRGRPEEWLRNLSIVADCNTTYPDTRVNRTGQGADAEVLRKRGFVVVPPAWTQDRPDKPSKPTNPGIRDRVGLIHRLMHEDKLKIHGDCTKLLQAIEDQTCDDRGLPVKVPGQASDRLSGPADGFGYKAYRIWHGAVAASEENEGQWQ